MREVNQFIIEHAEDQMNFKKIHIGLSCPNLHVMSRIYLLFRTFIALRISLIIK